MKTFDKASDLGNHLVEDGFFGPWDGNHNQQITEDYALLILDDYNTSNMTNSDIRDFYTHAFRMTKVRRINIFYQGFLKKGSNFREWAEILHEDQSIMWSFLCAAVKKWYGGKFGSSIAHAYINGDLYRNVTSACEFIHEMCLEGIEVYYYLYENKGFFPPFHGRYWLDNNVGYIVDGSLNTYGARRVFAQKMDDENYDIIREIVRRDVVPYVYPCLTETDFRRVFAKIELNRDILFGQEKEYIRHIDKNTLPPIRFYEDTPGFM